MAQDWGGENVVKSIEMKWQALASFEPRLRLQKPHSDKRCQLNRSMQHHLIS